FDLAGHTAGNRLLAFARRPAPVQVTWLGYVGTTGLEAMDYLLADQYLVPPGAEGHHRERVLRLPASHLCYDPPADAPDPGPPAAPHRGRGQFRGLQPPAQASPRPRRGLRRGPAARAGVAAGAKVPRDGRPGTARPPAPPLRRGRRRAGAGGAARRRGRAR